jgi:two-component system response regulator MprA
MRLLVIEDEYAMRRALEDILVAEGYRVFTAADGQDGLDRASASHPDLVLLVS